MVDSGPKSGAHPAGANHGDHEVENDRDLVSSDVGNADYDGSTKKHGVLARLYAGTGAFNIVGRRRIWFAVTAIIFLLAAAGIGIRGFNLGIDFEGGTLISFSSTPQSTTDAVSGVYKNAVGRAPVSVQKAGSGGSETVQIRSEHLTDQQLSDLQQKLFNRFRPLDRSGQPSISAINTSEVSSSWGSDITRKALIALVVFLLIVGIYIVIRFELDMAIAAIAALIFDLVVTAGVYAWIGFEVSPATVIGLLTILGFSLYDSVVVFDKVHENTRDIFGSRRRTYAEQANLAVNQTLMRSINTTVISIIPILSLIIVAVGLLGVGTLKDLALVQMVGVIVGAFSSIFFATPLLVTLKGRREKYKAHTARVLRTRSRAENAVV